MNRDSAVDSEFHTVFGTETSTKLWRFFEQREQLAPVMLFINGYRPFAFILNQFLQMSMPIVALLHLPTDLFYTDLPYAEQTVLDPTIRRTSAGVATQADIMTDAMPEQEGERL